MELPASNAYFELVFHLSWAEKSAVKRALAIHNNELPKQGHPQPHLAAASFITGRDWCLIGHLN